MASLFFFLSLLCYIGHPTAEGASERRRPWLAALSIGCSLLTYPIALGGLAVFVLLDLGPLRRLSPNIRSWWTVDSRKVWLEKRIFLLTSSHHVWGQFSGALQLSEVYPIVTFQEFSLAARAMQALWVFAWFIWKPWVPVGLAPKYPDLLTDTPFTAQHVAAAALVLGITLLLILRRRIWPGLLLRGCAIWPCYSPSPALPNIRITPLIAMATSPGLFGRC